MEEVNQRSTPKITLVANLFAAQFIGAPKMNMWGVTYWHSLVKASAIRQNGTDADKEKLEEKFESFRILWMLQRINGEDIVENFIDRFMTLNFRSLT